VTHSFDVGGLPAFVALDGYAVLSGRRRGASIQLDETYFDGRQWALRRFDTASDADREVRRLEASRERYDDAEVSVDAVTETALMEASAGFRDELQRIPELESLARAFPGRCFVVHEWMRTGDRLQYGARVYLFRDDDAPTPEAVVRKNVESVTADAFEEFERYQGRLHGYPDCCIDFYRTHSQGSPSPEWRSVEPFADAVHDAALGRGVDASIDDVVRNLDDRAGSDAFFARAFFPEPDCETAVIKGRTVRETLSSAFPKELVRDYYRLNVGLNYLLARSVERRGDCRPAPGTLGREHLRFYLPLADASSAPRYA